MEMSSRYGYKNNRRQNANSIEKRSLNELIFFELMPMCKSSLNALGLDHSISL